MDRASTQEEHRPAARGRTRLADEVYDTLLAQLMSLRIRPGSRVTIDALARELGVSQTPIRDALNRMETDGLVVRVHLAGYRIPPQITRPQFEDMLEVRLLLEPACARRAAENATPEQSRCRLLDEMARPEMTGRRWPTGTSRTAPSAAAMPPSTTSSPSAAGT